MVVGYVPDTPDIAEFTDPRLVAIYDTVNPYADGTQPHFYAALAAELGASSIVDLGCGTGQITCALAAQGYRMTGVDPAPGMLAVARERPHAAAVHWILGDAREIGRPAADLAIMTGHVAQLFVTDEGWAETLTSLHDALAPGGRLAFETRNPQAREWERWTREFSVATDDPRAGRIEAWSEVHDVADGIVSYVNHYAFAATGEELVSRGRLRFRTIDELTSSLAGAGFSIERVYGDWDRRPSAPAARELIVVAACSRPSP